MNNDKQIIAKLKELIKAYDVFCEKLLQGFHTEEDSNGYPTKEDEVVSDLYEEIAVLESEEASSECSCNSEVIGSYANCPIHSPGIDKEDIKSSVNNAIEGWLARNRFSAKNSRELKDKFGKYSTIKIFTSPT